LTDRARKRRRQRPAVDEIFEEPPSASKTCRVAGCPLPATDDEGLCAIHVALAAGKAQLEKRAARAARDPLAGLLAQAGAAVLELATPWVGTIVARATAPRPAPQPSAGAPRRPSTGPDPFVVLGLDSKTATVAQVRQIQRKLAAIYHADTGGDSAASNKLAEINAAASEAIRRLAPQ
jgi:hypothetical protein